MRRKIWGMSTKAKMCKTGMKSVTTDIKEATMVLMILCPPSKNTSLNWRERRWRDWLGNIRSTSRCGTTHPSNILTSENSYSKLHVSNKKYITQLLFSRDSSWKVDSDSTCGSYCELQDWVGAALDSVAVSQFAQEIWLDKLRYSSFKPIRYIFTQQ